MRWLIAALAILLVACSNPRQTPLPKDLSQMSSISSSLEKLTDPEKQLVAGYVMRHTLGAAIGSAFGAKTAGIPDGMTIGRAIEEQRKWIAETEAQEEAERALREKLQAEREAALKLMREAVTVTLVSKKLAEERGYSGILMDENLEVVFGYKNNTGKDIAGVKGRIAVQDLFGDELSAFQVSNDDGIRAGGTRTWSGSRSVQFSLSSANDRKLAGLASDKYRVVWDPQTIIFADGTSLKMPE